MNDRTDQVEVFRSVVERSAFGVCQDIAERIGIQASKVRIYFIYISFIAMGSPVIIYFVLAFWKNIKKYLSPRRDVQWD